MQSTDYSFRKDFPILSGPVDGCSEDPNMNDQSALVLFPNGVSFTDFELNEKQRIPSEILAVKITDLKTKNLIPEQTLQVDQQIQKDTAFYQKVKQEYCWYENRYSYLLKKYLKLLMSDNRDDIQTSVSLNTAVTELNKRLQSLLEIMNAISNERAKRVDNLRTNHNTANTSINKNLDKLADIKRKLGADNLRLTTQREMQRFTEEKNRALRLQVMTFAVLNVVALGVVYTAYRSSQ